MLVGAGGVLLPCAAANAVPPIKPKLRGTAIEPAANAASVRLPTLTEGRLAPVIRRPPKTFTVEHVFRARALQMTVRRQDTHHSRNAWAAPDPARTSLLTGRSFHPASRDFPESG